MQEKSLRGSSSAGHRPTRALQHRLQRSLCGRVFEEQVKPEILTVENEVGRTLWG